MRYRRAGFSIIELLVTIAIIGLLLAILLPVLQRSRETARRAQCLNNLRQLGVALHSYHAQFSMLPQAAIWGDPPGEPLGGGLMPIGLFDRVAKGLATPADPSRMHANWAIMILPQLDQANLFDAYDPNVPVADPVNRQVRETRLSVFTCPTDTSNTLSNFYVRDETAGTTENRYARGNYGLNFGPDRECIIEADPMGCTDGYHVDSIDLVGQNKQLWGSGVGGFNQSFSFADVTAGQSNVVMLDEIRAGPHRLDSRGSWALGFVGASLTARHGLISSEEDAYGPNNQHPNSDDIVGCIAVDAEMGPGWLASQRMPCYKPAGSEPELNDQATARSMHSGGVQVLMVDGAAHWISDSVNPQVWFHIHNRESAEAIELPF